MCKGLGVRSVAEYVETEEPLEAVRSHGLKRDLYIVGDGDLARALFEFEDTVEEACESMYQGNWDESMPTRVAVLPLSQSTHAGLEMLEQIRIRTVFAERDHDGVVFRDLEAVLEGLS